MQFSANRQLPGIRHDSATFVSHHAIAARQDFLRIEQHQVLCGIVYPDHALCLRSTNRLDQSFRQIGLPVAQTGEIAACRTQPLHQRLPLPVLMLFTISVSTQHALLQLVQLLGTALQLLSGMHQSALQVIQRLHRILQPVALGALQVLRLT